MYAKCGFNGMTKGIVSHYYGVCYGVHDKVISLFQTNSITFLCLLFITLKWWVQNLAWHHCWFVWARWEAKQVQSYGGHFWVRQRSINMRAMEKLNELCTLLAGLYADAGHLPKAPSWSWIEINGRIHKFVVNDGSHLWFWGSKKDIG